MNANELLKETKELVAEAIDLTGDIVPIVGAITNFARRKRFTKRINAHEKKLKDIFYYISQSDVEYFAEKIGTMVFEKIMNDQEDDKAEFLVLGFENCVKNEIKDDDLIIYYFDLLTELRVMDLKRFVSLSRRHGHTPILPIMDSDEEMLIESSDSKLYRMGLITAKMSWSTESGEKINSSTISISKKGNLFLDFIGF